MCAAVRRERRSPGLPVAVLATAICYLLRLPVSPQVRVPWAPSKQRLPPTKPRRRSSSGRRSVSAGPDTGCCSR
eukprot:scaffold486503_cov44-Prasinocladus_malaysianus.AAC.2